MDWSDTMWIWAELYSNFIHSFSMGMMQFNTVPTQSMNPAMIAHFAGCPSCVLHLMGHSLDEVMMLILIHLGNPAPCLFNDFLPVDSWKQVYKYKPYILLDLHNTVRLQFCHTWISNVLFQWVLQNKLSILRFNKSSQIRSSDQDTFHNVDFMKQGTSSQ